MLKPRVSAFFDQATFTVSYVVAEPDGRACAIVDPVLDFDIKSGRTSTKAADAVIERVRAEGLEVAWLLETHAHADHLTAAPYLQEKFGGRIAIGARIAEVQQAFGAIYNLEPGFRHDGSQFDRLWRDGERFRIGALEAVALATPGHTPACMTYAIGDAAFVGDTLFMPDYGSARCDFPGGDARTLYRSIRRILELPPETRLFMCHDYGPNGRPYAWETTVAEERAKNVHVRDGVSEDEFVTLRTERDRTLATPALLLPSVQVNIRAGRFPPPDENGVSYLKLPLNAF
jgi:glyoxylase-like metal-dependent hydrolase (beta-lactamase superfamily II)